MTKPKLSVRTGQLQRAVRHARQARPEAAVVALLLVLLADGLFDLLPLHAERRVGEHVVEQLSHQAVVAEGVAQHDVADVLAADQHVRLADGVRLGVQFLAEERQPRLGVQLEQILAGHAKHAAGAGRGVVHHADHAGFGQSIAVLDEQQVHHQPDHLAWGEVLTGRLVGQFGELADQLLEHQPHLHVVHALRVQVDGRELLGHQVQQLGLVQPLDGGGEVEMLEDGAHVRRETLDVAVEVGADVVLVAHELAHVQRRDVVEVQSGLALDKGLEGNARLLLVGVLLQRGFLGGGKHAVQAAQHREGQDNAAVLALLEVAAQQVGHRPDEG